MVDRLKHELMKISPMRDTFRYIQNNNEFLSIVFVIDQLGFNAFISTDHSPIRCSNAAIETKMKSIVEDRQTFSDGSTFQSHFGDNRRIGMV